MSLSDVHSRGRLGLLDDGVQDVRYGLRGLRRNPALTLVVIAMLGLGIGASTAIFSVMNATLLRPLPYANAHELVTLWHSYPLLGGGKFSVSVPGYLDYIELNRTFAAIAATRNRSVNLSGGGDPVRLIGLGVTANFFETIGVSPQVGRTFVAQEDQPNADTVAVLSHGLWERQFAADPAVVGQRVLLDGRAHDVIGVLPTSFVFPGEIDIYLPAAFTPQERENRGGEFLSVVARLRSDVSLSEAQSDMARISRLLQPQFYAFDDRWHLIVEPFQAARGRAPRARPVRSAGRPSASPAAAGLPRPVSTACASSSPSPEVSGRTCAGTRRLPDSGRRPPTPPRSAAAGCTWPCVRRGTARRS